MPTIHSHYSESSGSGIYVKLPKITGFTPLELLHEGSYCSIYRARQDRLGRIVALKLLQEWPPPSDVALERFNRAAYVGAQALHPNLVTVHDTGTKDGYHYAIMEYIEGQTMQRLLAELGRIDEKIAVKVGLDISRALVALHARDICHRNVKPKNIFIEKSGRVRLVGVGLASCKAAFFSPHLDAHAIGTPHFMAPEMIRGSCADPRSDLYSLGVTLYVMLTGHPPFERGIPAVVMSRHLTDKYIPLSDVRSDVSSELVKLVHALMERDVEKRIQAASEAVTRFEKIAAKVGSPAAIAPARLAIPAATRRPATGLKQPAVIATISMLATLGLIYGGIQGVNWFRGSALKPGKVAAPDKAAPKAPLVITNETPANEDSEYQNLLKNAVQYERNPNDGLRACQLYVSRNPKAPAARAERIRRLLEYYRGRVSEIKRVPQLPADQTMEF